VRWSRSEKTTRRRRKYDEEFKQQALAMVHNGQSTYDFFDQCLHRMACAKCSFYAPKESTQAQLLEAKTNLERMMQEIPLREEERAAVEDGLVAVEKLCARLLDVPTPAGLTPREIKGKTRLELPILR